MTVTSGEAPAQATVAVAVAASSSAACWIVPSAADFLVAACPDPAPASASAAAHVVAEA